MHVKYLTRLENVPVKREQSDVSHFLTTILDI